MYFKETDKHYSREINDILLDKVSFKYDNEKVGHILYVESIVHKNNIIYIENITVYPEYREQGFSESIIKDMCQLIVDTKVNIIYIRANNFVMTYLKKTIDKYTQLTGIEVNYQ